MASGATKVAATIVGWVIVAVAVYVALGALMATIGFVVRVVVWAVVIGAIVTLYLNLKASDG